MGDIDSRYRVLKKLGSGSMGVVYLAHDVFLDRQVAIKLIDPAGASDPMTTERFKKEAQALAKVRHANVVQIYAFGRHEKSFFFAMEYVDGRSLEEAIDAGETVDVAHGIDVLRAVASGLSAVHELKLVHRDVKPSNIVIENATGRPVLIDFGLARRRSASNPRMSITAGTPMYMAPEQSADPNGTNVTFRADIYALACTAFELFTGNPVFEGKDVFEILDGHLKHPAPPVSQRRPDLAMLDAAFARALAKDPLARHDTAVAFVDELAQAFAAHAVKRRDTLGPTEVTAVRAGPEERVLVLGQDPALVRQMSRVTKRVLGDNGREGVIEQVATARELVRAFARLEAAIVIIDEESCEIHAGEVVRQLQSLEGGRFASILVVSRSWQELRPILAVLHVRDVLPKPLVVQMLAAAVERIVARRSVPDIAPTDI